MPDETESQGTLDEVSGGAAYAGLPGLLDDITDDADDAEEADESLTDAADDEDAEEPTLGADEPDGDDDADDADAGEDEDEDEDGAAAKPAKAEAESKGPPKLEPTTPIFTIPDADGKEKAVTVAEAREGYLRTQDYTRKTMALAESQKALTAQIEQYKTVLGQYEAFLKAADPEPDWDKLRAEDPTEYLLQKDLWEQRRQEQEAVAKEKARLAQEDEEKQRKELAEVIAAEMVKLKAKLPAWADQKVAQREVRAIRKGLIEHYGFTDAEVAAGLIDHRLVVMVRDALLYQAGKTRLKSIKPVTPTRALRPGPVTTPARAARKSFQQAKERLARSGSAEDAGAAFEAMGVV